MAMWVVVAICLFLAGQHLSSGVQTGSRSSDDVTVSIDDVACTAGSRPRVITDYSGTLTSPNFPDSYPPTSNCQWLIVSQEPGGIVEIDIDFYETLPWYDTLVLNDGNTTQSPIITSFDGTWNGWPTATGILSTGSTMLITFTTIAAPVEYRGFNLTFLSRPTQPIRDPCYRLSRPQFVSEFSGTLTTNGHPDKTYLNYAECEWLIESQVPNGVVEVSFNTFWTEEFYDSLSIYDGSSAATGPLIVSLSGLYASQPPPSYRSTQQYMFLRFSSDQALIDIGFSLNFTSVSR